ncbi:MAG: sigma-70 family RNA polymerase sigma factor [Bacteroidetes bacterium]|nr:sigma-70 family RNA polymerase sigma factor [Bacteroidota bacterium]
MSDTKKLKGRDNIVTYWRDCMQAGDDKWLDAIYRENKEKFISWGKQQYNFDKDALEDVFQRTMISFYENIYYNKIDKLESSLSTYLFGIGKNLILKEFRENKKVQDHRFRLQEHWNFIHLPESDLEKTYEAVKEVLDATKEPCKTIIESYYLKGMSIDGIAKQQGYKNADVVKTQKSRCLKVFKEAVKNRIL